MYLDYFGFKERPFQLLPDPKMLYWSKAHGEAFAMMEYGIMSGAPITVVTGEVGAGKTTLIRHLLDRLDSHYAVGLISNAQRGRGDMLHWALSSLNQEINASLSYVQLFNQFQKGLIASFADGRRTLLIVDEAQNLDADSLEELRMFSNINSDKDVLLQLMLVGQPELGEIISKPELRQFAQRIASFYHIPNLTILEVCEYIRHRIVEVGGDPGMFTFSACRLIKDTSGGTPRLINVIAELALVHCFSNDQKTVTPEVVNAIIPHVTRFGAFLPVGGAAQEVDGS